MIVLRWIVGILVGAVAALAAFVFAALLAGQSGGAFGLAIAGFGLAFFPALFTVGTTRVRTILRRATGWFAFFGLVIAGVEGYQLSTQTPLINPDAFSWLRSAEQFGTSVSGQSSPLWVMIAGVFLVLLSFILFLLLRAAKPAKTQPGSDPAASKSPAAVPAAAAPRPQIQASPARVETPAAPAQTSAPQPTVKSGSDDEDAQLMADLQKLRERLPKMGQQDQ